MFTPEELKRYSRQILLPELKSEGQEKLKKGSVLVIGAGGLGSPALYYLTAAGVGRIGILDFDVVDESNLQRQILYNSNDVGGSKVGKAAERLSKLNPHVKLDLHPFALGNENAMNLLSQYDVIIDGSDNLPTRYLVNDACVFLKKTLIYGAVFQFEGQVSVFNQLLKDGTRGPNYRDLFPEPPPPELVPSCGISGVLGVLPGIIGAMQANEAIKILTAIGETLSGRLMIFDSLDFTTRFLKIQKNIHNPVSGDHPSIHGLIDYEAFCNPASYRKPGNEILPEKVKAWLSSGEVFQLIDVREKNEYAIENIGGLNIPLSVLKDHVDKIDRNVTLVIHCESGQRSARAIEQLEELGFTNLLNMKEGLMGWRRLKI